MAGREGDDLAAVLVAHHLNGWTPGVTAVPMACFCLDKHEHVGVLAWVEGGGLPAGDAAGAIFFRCGRQWYGWRTTAEAARTIDWARQSGAPRLRMLEMTLNDPGNAQLWRMFRSARVNPVERDGRRLARALGEWSVPS